MLSSDRVKKILGANLKLLRKSKNLTQEKLAEIVGMERKMISGIENGHYFVYSELLAKLCNYFDVQPEFFFKTKHSELSKMETNLKREIDSLLTDFDDDKLQSIYNYAATLKK